MVQKSLSSIVSLTLVYMISTILIIPHILFYNMKHDLEKQHLFCLFLIANIPLKLLHEAKTGDFSGEKNVAKVINLKLI